MVSFFFVNTIMDNQKCLKISKLLKTQDFFSQEINYSTELSLSTAAFV